MYVFEFSPLNMFIFKFFFLIKMIDLYTGLRMNRNVVISGAPFTGKTKLITILSNAINSLAQANENAKDSNEENEVLLSY